MIGLPPFHESPEEVRNKATEFWPMFIAFVSTQSDKFSRRTLLHVWLSMPQGKAASPAVRKFVNLVIDWLFVRSLPIGVLTRLEEYYTVDGNQMSLAQAVARAHIEDSSGTPAEVTSAQGNGASTTE